MTARPSPGDLLVVDGRASVQFAGDRALTFRVVSVSSQPTYHGWIWLTGYVVNRRGEATAKREIYVQLAGLRPAADTPVPPAPRSRGSRVAGTLARDLATQVERNPPGAEYVEAADPHWWSRHPGV